MRFLFLTFVVAWSSIDLIATEPMPYCVSEERRQESLENVIDRANDFAVDFFEHVSKNRRDNFVAASYETFMGLSKLFFATGTSTREELTSALGLSVEDCQEVQYGYQALIDRFNSLKNSSMNSSNTIFYPDRLEPRKIFREVMLWTFRDEAKGLNSENLDQARDTINAWSAIRTNNNITKLVASDDLSTEPSLVLAIVAHFKGLWAAEFSQYTSVLPRSRNDESYICAIDYFNCGNITEFAGRYVEIPCKSDDSNKIMSMFLIIPSIMNGSSDAKEYVKSFVKAGKYFKPDIERKIEVVIPKFTIRKQIDLHNALHDMLLIEMFNEAADFGGIFDPPPSTKVHKVIQEVVVEVEANQDPSIYHLSHYAPRNQFVVKANESFIFMIVEIMGEKAVVHLIGYYEGIRANASIQQLIER